MTVTLAVTVGQWGQKKEWEQRTDSHLDNLRRVFVQREGVTWVAADGMRFREKAFVLFSLESL